MKTICFFLNYSPTGSLPLYVDSYLKELNHYFDELWLVSNLSITELPAEFPEKIKVFQVKNEGYDFGMFYKCIQSIDLQQYRQIACVNDSNVMIKGLAPVFDWAQKQDAGYWGLIDSKEKPWFSIHQNNHHIQSHFIVFNLPAISLLPEYFNSVDVESIMKEDDPKKLRRMVINDWEIGISQFLIRNGIKGAVFIEHAMLVKKYNSKARNVTFDLYSQLIAEGYPLIKKKVILKEYSWRHWLKGKKRLHKVISQYGQPDPDLNKAISEIISMY